MKYKIEIWQFHSITDTHKSNTIKEILKWYREKWQIAFEYCNCTFYVYKNGKLMEFDELFKLGFYDVED